jgi:hypothetical protein
MIPQWLKFRVRRRDAQYVAIDATTQEAHLGGSPDESLGAAVRASWLAGWFNTPVLLELDIASDEPEEVT